jgi:hypothetical protein
MLFENITTVSIDKILYDFAILFNHFSSNSFSLPFENQMESTASEFSHLPRLFQASSTIRQIKYAELGYETLISDTIFNVASHKYHPQSLDGNAEWFESSI